MDRALVYLTIVLTPVTAALFQVSTQDKFLVAEVGSDISLPCTLTPPQSPDGLDVRWFHNLFHQLVFILRDGREDRQQQNEEYRGRASLPTGPDTGNLTLILRNVQLSDAGKYHCFVEDRNTPEYEEAFMELMVVGLGTPPAVEVSLQDNSVLLSCSSTGWFPEPAIRWEKEGQYNVSGVDVTHSKKDGLFSIKSDILLSDPRDGKVFCGVRHPVMGKETGTYVKISERKTEEYDKKIEHLRHEIDWRKVSVYKEPILFDHNTAFPGLLISPDFHCISTGERVEVLDDNPERFDTEPCVLGTSLFTSGVHYWETEIQERGGHFWSLGIARHSVRRKGGMRESPETEIWAFRATKEGFSGLTSPPTPISLHQRPVVVGTYLDCEEGKVTFYDANSFQPLFEFMESDFVSVYPFYYVGTGVTFRLNP
uniref:Uncharacterized protein n=1 Tax=Leptobrachium leishanense TaxID=445787 RepID=A0A8C5WIL1_9ANUR